MSDPIIKRGPVRSVIGVEVDTLTVSLLIDKDTTFNNVPLAQFAMDGGFDGTRMSVDRFFSASWTQPACGSLNLFTGRVSEVEITSTEVQLTLKSELELLNVKLPRNVYQAQCVHTVYDAGCGLVPAAWTVAGTVTGGSTRSLVNCNLAQASGYFDLGTMTMTSGPNVGHSRTVKRYTTGALVPSAPFPFAPGSGDTFTAKPGCDRLRPTCNGRFGNEANIRIYPYIPVPEATI